MAKKKPKGYYYPPPDENRCTAIKKNGERCKRAPIKGSTVCQAHGGRLSNVREAAKRRIERQKAQKLVEKFGLPRNVPPGQALLEAIQVAAGAVAFIQTKVAELDEDEVAGMMVTRESESVSSDGVRTITIERYASVNVWVKLLKEWQDHLAKLVKTTMEAGVAERQIRVMEHTVSLFSTALRGIMRDLGIPWDDNTRQIVRRHLVDVDITDGEEI